MTSRTLSCGCYINTYGIREHYCREHREQAEKIWQRKTLVQRLPSYLGIIFVVFISLLAIASLLFFVAAIFYGIYLNW